MPAVRWRRRGRRQPPVAATTAAPAAASTPRAEPRPPARRRRHANGAPPRPGPTRLDARTEPGRDPGRRPAEQPGRPGGPLLSERRREPVPGPVREPPAPGQGGRQTPQPPPRQPGPARTRHAAAPPSQQVHGCGHCRRRGGRAPAPRAAAEHRASASPGRARAARSWLAALAPARARGPSARPQLHLNSRRGQPWMSVVVPAFNEERAIAGTVTALRARLEASGRTWEIVVVDNASRDTTVERLGPLLGRRPRAPAPERGEHGQGRFGAARDARHHRRPAPPLRRGLRPVDRLARPHAGAARARRRDHRLAPGRGRPGGPAPAAPAPDRRPLVPAALPAHAR